MAECIHGFEEGMCDSCYPKAPKAEVVPIRRSRPSVAPRTAGSPVKRVQIAAQRIYHVTHIQNLEGILDYGLLADAKPEVDVSSALTRELRSTADVEPGSAVASYVPFYLAPDSTLWEQLRDGASDPRWSAAARDSASADYVVLVTTVGALGTGAVVVDGDAAGSSAVFATTPSEVDGMLRRLHGTDQVRDAEVLVKDSFSFESVQLIGVANEPMRDRVRELVGDTKVAVYPPWFQ
jgi:ssDNA thymidine ADP-ribosyltransferase, DarT